MAYQKVGFGSGSQPLSDTNMKQLEDNIEYLKNNSGGGTQFDELFNGDLLVPTVSYPSSGADLGIIDPSVYKALVFVFGKYDVDTRYGEYNDMVTWVYIKDDYETQTKLEVVGNTVWSSEVQHFVFAIQEYRTHEWKAYDPRVQYNSNTSDMTSFNSIYIKKIFGVKLP